MINAKDYIERRLKLYNLLPKNSIVIVYARDILQRIPTIPYTFNQFSDYLYLKWITCDAQKK